ncbi:MAG: phospholipase [Gammaproteobacteria bacterium]|nr:phospholipase [Gammaproteobacteria bacterium]
MAGKSASKAAAKAITVVLVHGWSVRTTETYGALPEKLRDEARKLKGKANAPKIDVHNIWLSRYISFHNEVRLKDIARALDAALRDEFGDNLEKRKLAMITHSTGGPAVREWLQRHYVNEGRKLPLDYLVMLAPANFGSALAQLGRTRLGRLKAWFEGVEPGLGVLDWLELGSPESMHLNGEWRRGWKKLRQQGLYSFVLTGASIDHKAYDHVNSYTGEMDSDGVVRTAAANLNHRHLTLEQASSDGSKRDFLPLVLTEQHELTGIPFRLLPGMAHSGDRMGIQRSVRKTSQDHPTVDAILACLSVRSAADYRKLDRQFARDSVEIEAAQRVEVRDLPGPFDRTRINDPGSQVVFRLHDDAGEPIRDFEVILTAGEDDPDRLPPGFLLDRQRNSRDGSTLTFYFNAARMLGAAAVEDQDGGLREELPGCEALGMKIIAYPLDGFVHYRPAILPASKEFLEALIVPHQTTVVDIVLHRVVRKNVFRIGKRHETSDFTRSEPGPPLPGGTSRD